MELVYNGPHDAVEVPDADLIVTRGDPIHVPDDVAKRLVRQNTWAAVTPPDTTPKAKPAPAADAATKAGS